MNKPSIEACGICGGDGTIDNSFGSRAKCPSCHGSGKRREDTGFHDVTKTKPSHHGVQTNRQGAVVKETKPTTPMGILLMNEVEKTSLSADAKAKLVLEIYEHEASHGQVTKTFVKKLRKAAGIKAGALIDAMNEAAGEDTELTEHILREEEASRAVAFGRSVAALGVLAIIILVTPQVALTTTERLRTGVPVAINTIVGAAMWWRARDASRYSPPVARVFVLLSAFAALTVIYALGVFTPVVIILTIGLGLDPRDRVLARVLPPLVIGSYLSLAVLVSVHAIPDIGAWKRQGVEEHLTMAVVITAVFIVQIIFVRATRRSREEAVARVRAMSRVVRTREAQLEEVRENLDVALRRGVTGRHTGSVIGGYRVGDVVGRGAMGEVYAAKDPDGVRLVALKVLLTPGDEEVVHRFLREAEIALKVRGPNLVDVYGMGRTDEGALYIVMELLEGRDLSAILRERRSLPLEEVVTLVEECARGLDELHAAGVIHRDLKPQNLFQPFMGEWKILDYGVSKLGGTGTMTKGDIIGTPAYMAPEQAQGKELNRRADVFSLGAVAYRSLTGRRAFGGSDVPQILYQVVHGKPTRAREIDPMIPYQVETVLMTVLEKDPADRYATASEFANALRRASEGALESTPELEEQTVRTMDGTGIRLSAPRVFVERRKTPRSSRR